MRSRRRDRTERLNPAADDKTEINGSRGEPPWRVGDLVMNLKNFYTEDRVYIPNGERGTIDDIVPNKSVKVVFDHVTHTYQVSDMTLTHAWASTVWKTQGLEADRVVCFFNWSGNMSREVVNTAVTRAKVGTCLASGARAHACSS